jgi:hypothetical protein
MHKSKFVSLTGGLGNQLFQYAIALYENNKFEIRLVSSLGNPRQSNFGKAEIYSFGISEQEENRKASWLTRKAAGFLLRQGIYKKRFERLRIAQAFTIWAGKLVLSVHFRTNINLLICKGVGFSELPNPAGHQLLIGYFQTFRWASTPHVIDRLQQINLIDDCVEFREYEELSKVEKPLVVHVRLGDYKNEGNFGTLPSSYYSTSISDQLKTGKYGAIWLFSDELEDAKKIIPTNLSVKIRLIEEINESAAATLQVMRLGHGYVIANSTYSWWGAFLSVNSDVSVVAPSPWFRNLPEPVDLVPPHWIRHDAGWR